MFSTELARIIVDEREREIRASLRLRALIAPNELSGERQPSRPALRPASQPARSR
jgi:hypothetical protein